MRRGAVDSEMSDSATWAGARGLLRRLRDVMARGGAAEERLDRVVRLIAADIVAEVCSIYIRRAGDVLELFATEGLRREAIHKTRLRTGEGLVGDIAAHARPLALAEAQAHPAFAYRPETGEEIYHSFLGVPILRAGRVLGVLVVQNRTRRNYGEEEIETLETVAMVLAELVASGDLVRPEETQPVEGMPARPRRLEGTKLAEGLATGRAWLHLPYVAIRRLVAESAEAEHERLNAAIKGLQVQLDELLDIARNTAGAESRDILEAYSLFARDAGWLHRIREGINSGLTAEAAVSKVQEDTRRRFTAVAEPYLRERIADFDDLANRLLLQLTGAEGPSPPQAWPDDMIVVARSLSPADLLEFPRQNLRAVLLEEGSMTAHVSIIARALEVPLIGGLRDLFAAIEPGDDVIVDGDNGQVFIRPGPDVRATFERSMGARRRQREAYARMRDLPAVTKDDVAISLKLNAGLLIDLPQLSATGADGVGLFRTELPFMVRSSFPDVDVQREFYREVLAQSEDRPVVFRTLDIGGDKPLPYLDGARSENPALGWRALRISLDRPAMLQRQLRALIQASTGHVLRIMFPMVAEVAEFDAARSLVEAEIALSREAGEALPERVEIGVMLEVPALVWQLPALLSRADFVSIGSNDLVQFLFASDRSDPRMADRYDALSPPVLSVLREVARQCTARAVPLTVCGEIAGRPLEAMALVGLGIRSLSMAPASIGPVKAMIRTLDLHMASDFVQGLLERPDHSLRRELRRFAQEHAVTI